MQVKHSNSFVIFEYEFSLQVLNAKSRTNRTTTYEGNKYFALWNRCCKVQATTVAVFLPGVQTFENQL